MPNEFINYLDLTTLLEAEKNGRLIEELERQRTSCGTSGLTTESYCHAILEMKETETATPTSLSVEDVNRKVFHSNY